MEELKAYMTKILEDHPYKIVISQPKDKNSSYKKLVIEEIQGKRGTYYQLAKYTQKQVFHINIEETDLAQCILTYFEKEYLQLVAWGEQWEQQGKVTAKGKLLTNRRKNATRPRLRQGNNKVKNYHIPEGEAIMPLVDMGIFTADGKVVRSMYDKYRQINRFIELVEDVWDQLPKNQEINIIDFGCGKSYLTFILYHYLVYIKKRQVQIFGLDLKEEVIKKCQESANRYGYQGLHFEMGDIKGYHSEVPIHMVISLHACDTATDYALYNAIKWKAKVILSVPCCQHELNNQIRTEEFDTFTRYGIIKERTAALITDSIRGQLLEYCGYKTQVMEFIDMEHSPKNILIRGILGKVNPEKQQLIKRQIQHMRETFSIEPTLYHLICKDDELEKMKDQR